MATELTSHQLKDELVSWCIKAWKTNGTPISFEKAIQRAAQTGPQQNLDKEKPGLETVILSTDEGYLEVTLDDKPSAAGELLERRQQLDKFIRDHPEISVDIDPLLDADIVAISWLDPEETSRLECMNRDQKIRLAAKYRLLGCGDVGNESIEAGAKDEPTDKPTWEEA